MTTHAFELVGGHPVLDFLNTINDWTASSPRDYLPDFGEALRFGAVSGVLPRADVRRLSQLPPGRELDHLRSLRSALERLTRALASGANPPASDLASISTWALDAMKVTQLVAGNGALTQTIDRQRAGAGLLRLRLTILAVELLSSPDIVKKLKTCPSCGWFFLDVSRNRSRRWCSMQTCGAASKARRYYWRSRKTR